MDMTRLHYSDGSEPPCCNLQEVDWKRLLGLKLKKSQGLTSLLQRRVDNLPRPVTDNINVGSQLVVHHHQPMSTEKLKASNFPISTISIGPWKRVARHEGELTAKLYFAKRKLVWEFLEGQLKSKIEVAWSDITAIKALMPPNQPGTLQIELGKAPLFFREIKPQPRKHTNWQQAPDFTEGHAPLYRRHYATFPPGALDIHYDKLLQCDQRLFHLSRNPFPTHHHSPLFNTTTTTAAADVAFNNHQQPIPLPPLDLSPFTPAVNFPHMVVESPRNKDTLLLDLENQTTTAAGMDVNYFHEASFLDSSGSHLHHHLIPPHDHIYNNNNNNIDDDQSLTAAGSFLSVDPEFMNLSVPYNSSYAGADNILQPPINTWSPPTPTLEDVVDTKPNLDDLDHHINYQNPYHPPPPQY